MVEDAIEAVEDEFFLWPCNVEVFNLWQSVQSQWIVVDGRVRRLDYPGVRLCLDMWDGIRRKERPAAWRMLQAMESASLEEWSD